jgi:hypothetical protein
MKTKTAKTVERNQRRTLEQISQQVEMALESDNTPEGVKDCLKTIIFEASNEVGLLLGEILQDDFSRVRATFPSIIEKLGDDYGRGVLHSIHAIVQYDTNAFKEFYEQRLDQDTEDLANLLSRVMKHPKMPTKLYNVMTDELVGNDVDADSPEWILGNLKKWSVKDE